MNTVLKFDRFCRYIIIISHQQYSEEKHDNFRNLLILQHMNIGSGSELSKIGNGFEFSKFEQHWIDVGLRLPASAAEEQVPNHKGRADQG